MKTNSLATALALSDGELLARIAALARNEREATAELVAYLAALEIRPSVYAAQGYGSLFAYCREALRLSEDAACNRIDAARVCRRFPGVLDLLAAGSLSLASIRMLKPHLTEANQEAVLEKAANRTLRQIQALIAELAPQPDVASSVRRLPLPSPAPLGATSDTSDPDVLTAAPSETAGAVPAPSPLRAEAMRPTVRATAPRRFRVQFTIDQETHDQLRRVQALLRREIPNGDPGLIFGRALHLLLQKVEKEKLGAAARARPRRSIRPGADSTSRHIPAAVTRQVWLRDRGQCAFVAPSGRRCTEQSFLEIHHVQPYALAGPATVANLSLRCRRHNQYEANLVFGPHALGTSRSGGEARRRRAADHAT